MTAVISRFYNQVFPQVFPIAATLTATTLPDQTSKVFIITGGNSGIGLELARILYTKNATIYIASRSATKATAAIDALRTAIPNSKGTLKFLQLDLNDLTTIAASAAEFARQESRLDVLWNNAGIAAVPPGSKSAQGYEAHMGVNCLGHHLFTQCLLPQLRAAAEASPKGSVRVVWTSSILVDAFAPQGGVPPEDLVTPSMDPHRNYAVSKTGNWFLAAELAKRVGGEGIVSITQNPGNLRTQIWRETSWEYWLLLPFLYGSENGAYTMLWAGLAEEITVEDGGRFAIPWGKWHPSPRDDLSKALKNREGGGTGEAEHFWKWCEEQIDKYR